MTKALGVVALLLVAVGFGGCEGDFTQAELEQIVDDVIAANTEVDTCTFDLTLDGTVEMVGGSEFDKMEMMGSGSGAVDNAARQMYMTMELSIGVPDHGTVEMPVEYYIVDGWMYTGIDVPNQATQWMRMEMPAGMWDKQSQI